MLKFWNWRRYLISLTKAWESVPSQHTPAVFHIISTKWIWNINYLL